MIRDLYKRFLHGGKDYPMGLDYIRTKVKESFFKNAHLKPDLDDVEFKKAIAKGRYWAREVVAVGQFKKYRAMKKRYY